MADDGTDTTGLLNTNPKGGKVRRTRVKKSRRKRRTRRAHKKI